MQMSLSLKNKVRFIDGFLTKADGSDPQTLNLWNSSNSVIISQTFNSVSKDIVASIFYFEVAAEIWKDLRGQFQQKNGPRLCHNFMSSSQEFSPY